VSHVDKNAPSLPCDACEGKVDGTGVSGILAAEYIVEDIFRLYAHQGGVLSEFAHGQGKMDAIVRERAEQMQIPVSVRVLEGLREDLVDQFLTTVAVFDQLFNGDQFQRKPFAVCLQFGKAGHGPILVQYFTQHARGRKAGEDSKVHRGFGMPGALENAARSGAEREDMAGLNKLVGGGGGIGDDADSGAPVSGADAGGDPFRGVDRNGEIRAVAFAVIGDHRIEAEALELVFDRGDANEATPVADHHVDRLGGGGRGGHDEVALVFAVLVIHNDDELARGYVVYCGVNGVKVFLCHRVQPGSQDHEPVFGKDAWWFSFQSFGVEGIARYRFLIPMEVREIAARLEEIGTLLELKGENPFKVRAYLSGARALESLDEDLDVLIREERLSQVQGIGKALTEKIITLREKDSLPFYDTLRASIPPGLMEMLEIPGFGPKKIRKVHEALGVDSIDSLKAACEDGRVADLPGFGKKSVENILAGIRNRIAYGARHLWWNVRAIALPLLEGLRDLEEVQRAEVAGSFRRARETVGDLDFIVSSDNPVPVMDWFTSREQITEVTARGETKSSVRFSGGLQADLRVVPDDRFVFALHHFTGSKDHNVRMRQRALSQGYSLSEWGIFNKNEAPADGAKAYERPLAREGIDDEAALFGALGLDYIPPEMREGTVELEQAEKGELPAPLPLDCLKGTFHNHTRASDGHHTLQEMARAAARAGLSYLGIADHSKASFQANGLREEQLLRQVEEISRLNKAAGTDQAHLFSGIEVDILKDGSLDFGKEILEQLDYCVMSVHASMSGMSEKEMTDRIIRAMESPAGCLKILGHPTGRLLLKREGYPVSLPEVIKAASRTGVLIELNANPWRMDMDWRYWRQAADQGVQCVITPDAHDVEDLSYLTGGILAARKAGLRPDEIFNTQSIDQMRSALLKAKAQ